MTIDITFWGVRGSVPSPLTPAQVQSKINDALNGKQIQYFGGNTTCVEVNVGKDLFILDMGTGVRELGKKQMQQVMKTGRLKGTILQSHVHWDHIQGLPFWTPMYLPRNKFDCQFDFYGGKQWDSKLDQVYRGQMDAPYFPVNMQELEQSAMQMTFNSVYDGWKTGWTDNSNVDILAHKLQHPQETFGYRINSIDGKSIAFTTDHEPPGAGIPLPLLKLVQGVDVWITDCQYSHDDYIGKNGPQKMGWGHSFPEYIARVAIEAKPKQVITTHHDPDASDQHIIDIANMVANLSKIETIPAYEGLNISI